MAQYDLLLTQNVAAAGVEFSEKYVNVPKGGLLSADASGVPLVLAPGSAGYMLVRDDAEASGLKWQAISAGHTQNTDTGTTAAVFELDSDGYKIELTAESASRMGVKVDGGASYADLQAKDATFARVTVSAAPSAGSDLANKTYVDGLLAANDAMVFKGTVGTGGTMEITALNALATYNAGWAYKVITAGTIKGKVCEVGDLVIATVDRSGSGNADADWTVVQTNLDGAVTGPASATDGYPALFDGATGKVIKAGTGPLGSAAYTASTAYATAAQGTLATNAIPKGTITAADQVVIGTAASTPSVLTVGASTFVGKKATGTIAAMSAAEARTILNVADGATANTKATGAEINTGTDDAKFATAKAIADSMIVKGPASSVGDRIALFDGTTGKLLKDSGASLSGYQTSWVTAPVAKTSTGTAGQIARDDNFIYVCTASNTWKRAPIATNW